MTGRFWLLPLTVVVVYPALIHAFARTLTAYHANSNPFLAAAALVTMLLASCIPVLAGRALILLRHEEGSALTRAFLYLMFATPPLFILSHTLAWVLGIPGSAEHGALVLIWMLAWIAVGVMLYLRKRSPHSRPENSNPARFRIVHGVTALCLLCGFLIAHLINNNLAVWSVELHGTAMKFLRLWYRSDWVEPLLLTSLAILIVTGVPMVAHYSRQRADVYRVAQMATGVLLGVFLCSHLLATLYARRLGIDTNWFFAAGTNSLLDGTVARGRLIPYYFFATLCLVVHVACGLRIVLLQHGTTQLVVNRAFVGLSVGGLMAAAIITAALLGFHVEAAASP